MSSFFFINYKNANGKKRVQFHLKKQIKIRISTCCFIFKNQKKIAIQSDVDPDSKCSAEDLDSPKYPNTDPDPKLEVCMSFMEVYVDVDIFFNIKIRCFLL